MPIIRTIKNKDLFKMKKITLILLICVSCQTPKQNEMDLPELRFETSNGTESTSYEEAINFYKALASKYESISIKEVGETDSGKPLHLVKFATTNVQNKSLNILINNGIHPGESDGIDATMLLFRDMAQGDIKIPEELIIYTIPIYNIGGALNRNSSSRVNQNGPLAYGFRGNALNYDLNRDFIKTDSKNMRSFATIFHEVNPHVFVDTHVSNGADYTYTLTHLYTQAQKLGGDLGDFFVSTFQPAIKENLALKNWEMTPYVNVFNKPPDKGFDHFLDTPRYSTGYAALWNSLGLMIETHMLKEYPQRVNATYDMLLGIIEESANHFEEIIELREKSFEYFTNIEIYPIQFSIDSLTVTNLNFKGFEATYKKSEVTGHERLFYEKTKRFEKEVPYFANYKPTKEVNIPLAYYVPSAYKKIIDLLKLNHVEVKTLKKDSIVEAEQYRIMSFDTYRQAYEGHYPHYNTKVSSTKQTIELKKDGFIIETNQKGIRYIIETLEPEAPDSFFNWNLFDTILQQKEGFSPYVFEDLALEILAENPELKKEFHIKKEMDKTFDANPYLQLDWIFKHSEYYEKAHLNYPILRLL